jgi:hypothetical protein
VSAVANAKSFARIPMALQSLLLFGACAFAFHAMLARSDLLMDPDALYHFKIARLILERGPWVDVSWLPFTVLGEHGPDHHWLFHLLISPLTLLGSDLDALAWAAAIVGAFVPAALLPMLARAGVPWPALFALAAVAASELMPARFLMLRAQNLALVFMVAALFTLASRRVLWTGIVAFLFKQAYHGAVILGLLAVATLAAHGLVNRRVDIRPALAAAAGVALGLLASPWFPANVDYLIFHTFFKVATGNPELVGTEWYRVPIFLLVQESWPAHALFALGIAAVVAMRPAGTPPRLAPDTLACVAMTLAFLAMYHFAWRFVEYYAPFAVISSGLLLRDANRQRAFETTERRVLAGALAALVAFGIASGMARMKEGMRFRFDAYADMMRRVDAQDPNPMVFNTHWPDFVRLFYWSERARFVAGLDGHYLLHGDAKRFALWYAIRTGPMNESGNMARVIRESFGAGWVVVPPGHEPIAQALARDPNAKLEMRTRDGWLFRLAP